MSFADGLKTIVVATDPDGRPRAALDYARKLAEAYGARLVLSYGLDPVDYAAVDGVPGRVLKRLTDEARASLDEMAADLMWEGVRSHSEVRQGSIAQMLVDIAQQYDAGLIVIGTKGNHGAGPVVVGAVAEQVVRLSTCPVLAVAEDWNAGEFGPMPGGPILLAIECNEAASAAVATATSLAEVFHRTLLALHARSSAETAAFLNPPATTALQFGIESGHGFPVRCIVRDGSPADVIDHAIRQHHPSLLVTGVKRASDTPGMHGTVFTLLASSRVPVLCVPPEAPAHVVHVGAAAGEMAAAR
jgi:nucleotide-binding universal stress UspA family protein